MSQMTAKSGERIAHFEEIVADLRERMKDPAFVSECYHVPDWPTTSLGRQQFSRDGKSRNLFNWICREFHGEPPEGKTIATHQCGCHGTKPDGLCINPHHLKWGDAASNGRDAKRDGMPRGTQSPSATLNEQIVLVIREWLLVYGAKPAEVAKYVQTKRSRVIDIAQGRTWSWLTGIPDQRTQRTA